MPAGLKWQWCELFSINENVLVEESKNSNKQLRRDQGGLVFKKINAATVAARSEGLRKPHIHKPHAVKDIDTLVKARKKKLEDEFRLREVVVAGKE
eukprot:7176326-Lingulodinium_polyedra.AAC.1